MERISQGKDGFNLKPIRKMEQFLQILIRRKGISIRAYFFGDHMPYLHPTAANSQFPGLKLVGVSYLREAINTIKLK